MTRQLEAPKGEIINTRRVERTLKILAHLSDWRSIKACSEEIGVHQKSIFRYLNMLVILGFVVEVTRLRTIEGMRNHYRVVNQKEYFNIK